MNSAKLFSLLALLISSISFATTLETYFKKGLNSQTKTLIAAQVKKDPKKSMGSLLEIIKNNSYDDEARWYAMSLTSQLAGTKSIPLLKKYFTHSNWFIRLAALKNLTQLKYTDEKLYAQALEDKAMVVRMAALESIEALQISKLGPNIWNMFSNTKNYVEDKGTLKRAEILNYAISVLGKFKEKDTKNKFLKILSKGKYQDLWPDVVQQFSEWTNLKAPKNDLPSKRAFWLEMARKNKI